MNIIGEEHPSPCGPKLDTVECPMCGMKHLAGSGRRFSLLPTITISKMVFNRIDDHPHHAVIYQWLNRDKTLMDLRRDLADAHTDLREVRRSNQALTAKLESITEQRNLYRSLVRNLDPHYDDDEL